jgi:predicted site-specific integrase-resolvase
VIAAQDTTYKVVEEVAKKFRSDPATVTAWCRAGKFPGAIRPFRKWLIPESDVLALLTGTTGGAQDI